jgi:hypothetical protein
MTTVGKPGVIAAMVLALGVSVPFEITSAATNVPTRHLTAKGGVVKFSETVKNAKTCTWSSSPKVAGFDTTVECRTGKVERSAKFKANTSTKAEHYTLTLAVRGKTTTVDHLKVVEAGKSVTTTTTTTTTATTTTATTTTATESFTPILTATEVPILSSATEIYFDINWDVSGLPETKGCPATGLGTLTFSFPQNPVSYPDGTLNLNLAWPQCYANYFEVTFTEPTNGNVPCVMDYSGGSYQAENGDTVDLEPEVVYVSLGPPGP